MIVKINFTAPFRGVVYANYDRESNCKFFGDGGQYYEMRIPLTGCGTKQVRNCCNQLITHSNQLTCGNKNVTFHVLIRKMIFLFTFLY